MSAPSPYYQDDACTIYHGDCREIMPELGQVGLVLTDPPYGINFRSNYRAIRHEAITGDSSLPVDLIEMAISSATRAAYVFCRWDQLSMLPTPKSVLVWVKNNWSMGDLKHEHGRQWEACCFYAGPGHRFLKRIPDVLHGRRTGNENHPTEKPVEVLRQIVAANEGDTVLDPFMGSGTTLRAAKDLGREAIGIEIEERYCEIAARRLAQEVMAL